MTARPLRRCPPGYYPANELHPHVTMAGSVLVCLACGAEGHTGTSSRVDLARYNRDVEAFVAEHRGCREGGGGVISLELAPAGPRTAPRSHSVPVPSGWGRGPAVSEGLVLRCP